MYRTHAAKVEPPDKMVDNDDTEEVRCESEQRLTRTPAVLMPAGSGNDDTDHAERWRSRHQNKKLYETREETETYDDKIDGSGSGHVITERKSHTKDETCVSLITEPVEEHGSSQNTGARLFQCYQCSYGTLECSQFLAHVEEHTAAEFIGPELDSYAPRRTRSKMQQGSKECNNTGQTYLCCTQCSYISTRASDYNRHVKRHSGRRPYKCAQCGYDSADLGNYRRHMKQHEGVRPHRCEVCGYRTLQLCNLKQHIATHTDQRPFPCPDCNYRAARKNHLKRHMHVHTGEKPYQCAQCDYSCAHSIALRQHIASKHVEVKPFKCPHDLCDYSTSDAGNLTKHARKHGSDKPHKCTECDFRTAYPGALRRHMVKHTGVKRYLCVHCGYCTAHLNAMQRHAATQHGDFELSESMFDLQYQHLETRLTSPSTVTESVT